MLAASQLKCFTSFPEGKLSWELAQTIYNVVWKWLRLNVSRTSTLLLKDRNQWINAKVSLAFFWTIPRRVLMASSKHLSDGKLAAYSSHLYLIAHFINFLASQSRIPYSLIFASSNHLRNIPHMPTKHLLNKHEVLASRSTLGEIYTLTIPVSVWYL